MTGRGWGSKLILEKISSQAAQPHTITKDMLNKVQSQSMLSLVTLTITFVAVASVTGDLEMGGVYRIISNRSVLRGDIKLQKNTNTYKSIYSMQSIVFPVFSISVLLVLQCLIFGPGLQGETMKIHNFAVKGKQIVRFVF